MFNHESKKTKKKLWIRIEKKIHNINTNNEGNEQKNKNFTLNVFTKIDFVFISRISYNSKQKKTKTKNLNHKKD